MARCCDRKVSSGDRCSPGIKILLTFLFVKIDVSLGVTLLNGLVHKFRSFRNLNVHLDPFILFQSSASLIFFTFLLIIPLASIISAAFLYNNQLSLHWFFSIFSDRYFFNIAGGSGHLFDVFGDIMYVWGIDHGIILNTLSVAVTVTVLSSFLGLVTAFIMARYTFPGKNIFRIALNIPMLATPFVNAYVLGKIFHPRNGFVNILFYDILHLFPYRIDLNGLIGIILAQTLSYFPIVYLNVFSSIVSIDPSLEEQAENLGAKGFTLFRKVTFPLSMPGLTAGAIIAFIFSMEDLAGPIGFIGYSGNPMAKKVVSYYIFQSFTEAFQGAITPETAALSVILLSLSMIGFVVIKRYVSLKAYATLSKGGRWVSRVRPPGRIGSIIIFVFLVLLVVVSSCLLYTSPSPRDS